MVQITPVKIFELDFHLFHILVTKVGPYFSMNTIVEFHREVVEIQYTHIMFYKEHMKIPTSVGIFKIYCRSLISFLNFLRK